MRDITNKQDNTPGIIGELSAAEYNDHKNELQASVERTGQALSTFDPLQLSRAMNINGVSAQSYVEDVTSTANSIVLTPFTGASGLVSPDSYTQLNGAVIEFIKGTANTSTSIVLDIGQTVAGLLGIKNVTYPDGSSIGVGQMSGVSRVRFNSLDDRWELLSTSTGGTEHEILGDLTIEGTELILRSGRVTIGDLTVSIAETVLVADVSTLDPSTWYFCSLNTDTQSPTIVRFIDATGSPAWNPTLSSNQLDLWNLYNSSVNYCRFTESGNTHRVLYAFKTDGVVENFEAVPYSVIPVLNAPKTMMFMYNSSNYTTPGPGLPQVPEFDTIGIDTLSEIGGAATARTFTPVKCKNVSMSYVTTATSQNTYATLLQGTNIIATTRVSNAVSSGSAVLTYNGPLRTNKPLNFLVTSDGNPVNVDLIGSNSGKETRVNIMEV
jgi:hypothetical protein